MNNPPRRDIGRYTKPVHEFASLAAFLGADDVPAGILTIAGALPIDLLYVPAGSDTTIVTFHAALSSADTGLPMFAGGKVTQDGPVNRIFVSDPGLYAGSTHTIAWFAGTRALKFQHILPQILGKLLPSPDGGRTLFWGPSAGGFGALYFSKLFPESLAVAINPQTRISRFGIENQRAYTEAAFGATTMADHVDVLENKINSDLIEWYAGSVPNHILYVQNESDSHVQDHMQPFLASLEPTTRVRTLIGNWGEGHRAPPPEEIRKILSTLTGAQGAWGDVLADVGLGLPPDLHQLESNPR